MKTKESRGLFFIIVLLDYFLEGIKLKRIIMQIKLRKTIKCHLKKIIRAWKKFNQVKLTARMLIFNRTADSLSAIVIFARPFSLSRPNFP